LHTGTWVTWVQ